MTMQTFTGREYLKIDIANNFGHDKLLWDQRLNWFHQNEDKLDDLVSIAKEPALFFAAVQAYRKVLAGEKIGYMISLDATSSGLQLLAALTGCPHTARLCNVINTGAREDAYTNVYDHMLKIVNDTAKIARDDVKNAVMTAFYTSRAEPKRVFGEGALLDIFYHTLEDKAPGAWELNEAMLAMWNPNALEHSWILPDNFHVHVKVMAPVKETVHFLNEPFDVYYQVNKPMREGRSLGANTIHSIDGMIVRELTRRCDYNPKRIDYLYKLLDKGSFTDAKLVDASPDATMVRILWGKFQDSGYLSARILDYLTEETMGLTDLREIKELLDSLPFRPFKVVSIHDCFRVLPHYGNDLREQYNLQLQLIAKSDMLQDIVRQLIGKPIVLNKLDPSMWKTIKNANYALS